MRKKLLFAQVLCLLLLSTFTFAQNVNLTGKVTDESGAPVVGAVVAVKGSKQAAVTDAQGNYTLSVPRGTTVVVSYVGHKNREYVVNSNTLDVNFAREARELDEIVVTALGIKKEKKAVTYSVSEVKGSELTEARSVNIANSLEGKVAGVNIASTATGPGGSARIIMRGNRTLSGDNQPLIVIDGIPMDNQNINNQTSGSGAGASSVGMWGGTDQGDGISSLNPDDIESISVLKGGTAAALYGSRASNGAILVTTKGGKVNQQATVEVNSNIQAEQLLYKKFNDYQYQYGIGDAPTGQLQGQKPVPPNAGPNFQTNSWGAKLDGSPAVQYDGVARPYSAVTNNLSKFYKTGSTFTNSVSLYGGGDKIQYRFAMSDLNNHGIMPNNTLKRDNLSLNLTGSISKKLSFITNVKYISEKAHNRPRLSDSPGNANYTLFTMPTSLSVDVMKKNIVDSNGFEKVWSNNQYVQNPYFAAYNYQHDDSKDRVIGTFEPKFNITDWLYVKGQMGFDTYKYRNTDITPTGAGYQLGGGYTRNLVNFRESNLGGIIGVDRKFGDKLSLNAFVGGNLMKQVVQVDNYGGSPFNIPFFYDISNVTPASVSTTYAYREKRINSVYASADLSYNNILFLTLTGRDDWFSTLASDKNRLFYPSAGLSFILSDAVRMPSFVNYAKARVAWSQVGGDADPYQLNLNYALSGANNGAPLAQINQTTVPNAKLQPRVVTSAEAGIEGRLFNNRLGLDLTVYNTKTTKDIVSATIAPVSGYTAATFNVGEITNKGVEMLLSYRFGNTKEFSYEPSINLGYNKSKVVALYGDLTQITVDNARSQTAYIAQEIGKPYSQVQVVAFKRNAAGQIIYKDNGFEDQAANVKDMGTGVSPWTIGWGNSFHYKSWALNILLDGKFGGVLYSGTQGLAYRYGLAKETLPGRETGVVGKGVGQDGHSANTVNVQAEAYYTNLYNFGEPFVYSSDFIKLRSLSLDYVISKKSLGRLPVKGIVVSLVGRNLWTIMKHTPNIDPESTYNNGNAQGLEFTGMPVTRTVGLNVNLKL